MKLYTAFIYDLEAKLHCTHKYLGQQADDDRLQIAETISAFFATPRTMPCILFNHREVFGPRSHPVNVLTPEPGIDWPERMFPELRLALDDYRPDDYGSYKPHVTTDALEIGFPFQYYALMTGGHTVLRKWR